MARLTSGTIPTSKGFLYVQSDKVRVRGPLLFCLPTPVFYYVLGAMEATLPDRARIHRRYKPAVTDCYCKYSSPHVDFFGISGATVYAAATARARQTTNCVTESTYIQLPKLKVLSVACASTEYRMW